MPRLYTFRERAFVKHGDRFDAASIHVERVFKPMEHVTLPLNAVADRLVPVSSHPRVVRWRLDCALDRLEIADSQRRFGYLLDRFHEAAHANGDFGAHRECRSDTFAPVGRMIPAG
jgi:hypothetical protein